MPTLDGTPELRLKFFVDACLGGVAVPRLIEEQGCRALTKHQQFGARHVDDVDWLAWCADEWIVLTKDAAIRRVGDEARAAQRHMVRMFYLPNQSLSSSEMVQRLAKLWPRISSLAQQPGPYIYAIYSDRVVEMESEA